jgi:cell division cycle 2-like protein
VTGDVVALKQVKMGRGSGPSRDGFPITALREINVLLALRHPNIVRAREMVVGARADEVFMVMDYYEHDLRTLLTRGGRRSARHPFSHAEIKGLFRQLLHATAYLHSRWFLHRDLKTSNLLLNNRGVLAVCDFGLARRYGEPLRPYTPLVVTLWYRAPELLLGPPPDGCYSTAVDCWSVGCILAEMLAREPLFGGPRNEIEQVRKIFATLGSPTVATWPRYADMPLTGRACFAAHPPPKRAGAGEGAGAIFPRRAIAGDGAYLSESGADLLAGLLAYDPERRMSASEALRHPWFQEPPLPQRAELMPTFPPTNVGV